MGTPCSKVSPAKIGDVKIGGWLQTPNKKKESKRISTRLDSR